MKNLFDKADADSIIARIETLTPSSKALWGKMNVSQMLAHTAGALDMTMSEVPTKQSFIGWLISPLVKKGLLGGKPFSKGSPTDPNLVIKDDRDFEKEKARLISLVKKLHAGQAALVNKGKHPFFGKMTPDQWAVLQYKHADHHLSQFGA